MITCTSRNNSFRCYYRFIVPVVLLVISSLSSCVTTRDLKYFQDISDSTHLNVLKLPQYNNPPIRPYDLLSLTIQTSDPTLTASINGANMASSSSASQGPDLSGYMVDSLGNIQVPILGSIAVGGMTISEATNVVQQKAAKYFVEPIVVLRSKGIKVTVLGEVGKPGVIYVNVPKASIIDLLGLVGDLTPTAQRRNLMLLRQNENGLVSTINIDLTKSDVLKSPYYYLKSNDVLVVQPNKQKAVASDITFTKGLAFATIGLSVVSTLLILLRNN